MNQTYLRWQEPLIKKALSSRRVLVLEGPRQCGKTTLVKTLAGQDSIYRTLDDETLLNAALSDPQGFVQHESELMIIDEIQRAPKLLQAIKKDVDENQQPGRFLLTGSAHIQSLPGVTESLAGRVRKMRLRPLSIGELNGNEPDFLEKAFRCEFLTHALKASEEHSLYNKDTYLHLALKGGYPELLRLESDKERTLWHQDYLDALIERDLKEITHIRRKDSMHKLIEILAAWSSKFMDTASVCKNLSIARPTVESYINALEALYLVERVRPWHKTDYDRVGKQEKLFMTDTGMMASILRWRLDQVRLDGDLNGKLIETFVFNQLSSLLDTQENTYALYHYRDREKREVDFIIEHEDGAILGIEVKAGSIVTKDMFKHLQWFRSNIVSKKLFVGVVLYTGEQVVSFGRNLWAVPLRCLC
jgi:uncharacterized protein